jgi:hypothetical protein
MGEWVASTEVFGPGGKLLVVLALLSLLAGVWLRV